LANQTPSAFVEDPLETVRAHIWVTPYCEEDLAALADLIGVEHVLFGSDWPHGEGLADPQSFALELEGFDEHAVTRVMRENARELLSL
jgi:predicted TIM-barrel fold metal-dependent hydrolase